MNIEVWSDIACPFCYIGKAHLEKALSTFKYASKIEVTYKSYQLDPTYNYQHGDTTFSVLTKKKGMSLEQVKQMAAHIEQMAKKVGITMNIEKTIPANTYNAHRLTHLANKENKSKEVMEALFKAHFTNGKNIEDITVLTEVGVQAGISKALIENLLSSDEFAYDVKQDIMESQNMGVSGVPFFLFNKKYAVSGAQPVDVFENALGKSFEEWEKTNPIFINLNTEKSNTCDNSNCEI